MIMNSLAKGFLVKGNIEVYYSWCIKFFEPKLNRDRKIWRPVGATKRNGRTCIFYWKLSFLNIVWTYFPLRNRFTKLGSLTNKDIYREFLLVLGLLVLWDYNTRNCFPSFVRRRIWHTKKIIIIKKNKVRTWFSPRVYIHMNCNPFFFSNENCKPVSSTNPNPQIS